MNYKGQLLSRRKNYINQLFDKYDLDNDGLISKDEVIYVGTKDQINNFYKVFDSNKDGVIDRTEYHQTFIRQAIEITDVEKQILELDAGIEWLKKYDSHIRKAKKIWDAHACLGKRYISTELLWKMLTDLGIKDKDMVLEYTKMDNDKNGVISFGEFISYCLLNNNKQ